jgi:hypothetical protein
MRIGVSGARRRLPRQSPSAVRAKVGSVLLVKPGLRLVGHRVESGLLGAEARRPTSKRQSQTLPEQVAVCP